MRCASVLRSAGNTLRALTLPTLLDTVRRDPGMTAIYYANRYFGEERQMEVTRVLWGELKLYGQVTIDRIDGPEEPPRWYPVFTMPRKIHKIRRHREEEEDLSILKQHEEQQQQQQEQQEQQKGGWAANETTTLEEREAAASLATEVENSIIGLIQAMPGHDIQFYISELSAFQQPYAPMAFRRLREAGIIIREQSPQGTFVWK